MIYLYVIYGIIIFYVLMIIISRKRLRNKMQDSIGWTSTLGTSIAINGNKRAGKTTSGAGFVHYISIIIYNKLSDLMDNNRKILKKIDFNKVESIFNQQLIITRNYDDALDRTIVFFIHQDSELDEYYYNYLSLTEKEKLLSEYIEAYFILNIRKKFVYSKGWMFNRITLETSKLYDPNSIELRNVLNKFNWQLDIANIIFDDEKSMDAGNVDSNKRAVKLSGSKEFHSLLANMFRELTYNIVIKQNSKDQILQERNLIDSNLFIHRRRILGQFMIPRLALELFLKFVQIPLKIYCFFGRIDFENDYLKRATNYRKLEYQIFRMCKALESFGYIKVRFLNYFDADDVGKLDRNLFDVFDCYFPIRYCYGVVDTYEYNCLLPYFKSFKKNSVNESTSKFNTNNRVRQYIKKLNEREV